MHKELTDLLTIIDTNKMKARKAKKWQRQIFVITSEYAELLPETDNPIRTSQLLMECAKTTLRAVAIRYWNGDLNAAFEAIYQRKRIRQKPK